MPLFIEFLKTSGRFDAWAEECPLHYTRPNAPRKRDVLGTIVLSVLAGHWRYAHMNAIRGDGVNPEWLGMTKVASEDSVRRALWRTEEEAGGEWMKRHLKAGYEPLLEEPWVLDLDATVKPLRGHREDAEVGYNPGKPGRPSHVYHSFFVANPQMVVDGEVQAGNQTASLGAPPELWALVDGLEEASRPAFLRGDCPWGTERAMVGAEWRQIPYVFKLQQTAKVKQLIGRLFGNDEWVEAGQQWQGLATELRLSGRSRARRVMVLRRPLPPEAEGGGDRENRKRRISRQLTLDLPEATHGGVRYEYVVLASSLPDEVRMIALHCRERRFAENNSTRPRSR